MSHDFRREPDYIHEIQQRLGCAPVTESMKSLFIVTIFGLIPEATGIIFFSVCYLRRIDKSLESFIFFVRSTV